MCKRHWKYKSGVPVKEEIIIVVHFANIFELRITSMIFISGRPLLWRDGQSGLLGQVVSRELPRGETKYFQSSHSSLISYDYEAR